MPADKEDGLVTRRKFLWYAGAGALGIGASQLLASTELAQATTIPADVSESYFTIQSPAFGRVNALNLGHGQFTGNRARFNEGLQWWQSDKDWHYMIARNPNVIGGAGYWATLPHSHFAFRDNTPYQISFNLDFEHEILHSFQITEGDRKIMTLDLSRIPMYAWESHDAASIEPQIQLYGLPGSSPAELLITSVLLKNSDGSVFYEDRFDRVRWQFGMAMKGGMIKVEPNGMRIYASPNDGIDVFRRLGERCS